MNIDRIKKDRIKKRYPKIVSAKISLEDYEFLDKNDISVSALLREAIKDLKEQHQ